MNIQKREKCKMLDQDLKRGYRNKKRGRGGDQGIVLERRSYFWYKMKGDDE